MTYSERVWWIFDIVKTPLYCTHIWLVFFIFVETDDDNNWRSGVRGDEIRGTRG